jgi:hypothetical protein
MYMGEHNFNKTLGHRWKIEEKQIHKTKIRYCKPEVKTVFSPTYLNRSKVVMMKEERCQQIEKDNRILYQKMLKIHKKPL